MHVLYLILKYQFLSYFPEKTISTELPFDFIKKLQQNWSDYKERYLSLCCSDEAAEDVEDLPKNKNRRKDYLFLLKLTKSFAKT